MALQTAAMQQGYTLAIASGFRSFARQQLIWNGKAQGTRAILDEQGCPIDKTLLSDKELLFAILRWSAIPGCSRHHWGTDIDVYDAASVSSDYTLQLTSAECTATGPFTAMHNWLDDVLPSSQFFRPYTQDIGGIAPERWHLSYVPAAAPYEQLLDETRLIDWIMSQDIALKNLIRLHWHVIFHRYVKVSHSV
jgi:LAS superfamily LD-carboxypeptidase LdcB